MRSTTFILLGLLLSLLPMSGKDSAVRRYLYLSTPDGAQSGGSGNGILVFDIDHGHQLVRRIPIPSFKDLRGFCASLKNHAVYYSTTSRFQGCFDIETERVVWEKTYEAGCDRACVTKDGEKLFIPTGWWWRGTNSGFLVANAKTGDVLQSIPVGPQAHNSLVSLDGRFVFLGTETRLTQFRVSDHQRVLDVTPVGESGVFPFTIDSRNRYAYVCLGKHVGVDIVDLKAGKVVHRLLAGDAPIAHRTHGAGLTPDERELWLSDQEGKKLFVFDNTHFPPRPKAEVELSQGGHGWITFSLDGKYAWCHTPDVFDAHTKKQIATLRDEDGRPVCSSKFIEVHMRDGKVVAVGDQFGLGRAHP